MRSKSPHERREPLAQLRVAVHDRLDLLIGHAGGAADDAVVELGLLHLAPAVELEHDRLGQAILAVDQAADVRGEGVGQHRHHARREVDRGAAQVGFLIQEASLGDVVRDVGDVDGQEPVAVRQPVEADGVVVVARRLGVDGHGGPGPEVGAPGDVLRGHGLGHARGLGLHLGGKGLGQLVLGHHHGEVDARVLDPAESAQDAAGRVAGSARGPGDLGQDHEAGLGVAGLARGNEELVQHPAIEGHDVAAEAAVRLVAAHDPLDAALEDADDPALGALGAHPLDADDHAVRVQRFLQIGRGDVDVGLARAAASPEPRTRSRRGCR